MIHHVIDKKLIEHKFLCFCSFLCIINGKRLNIANIFLELIKNENYKNILKDLICIDTDYELLKFIIDYDPTIAKSKYISKFLNSPKGTIIKKNAHEFRKISIQRTPVVITKTTRKTVQVAARIPRTGKGKGRNAKKA